MINVFGFLVLGAFVLLIIGIISPRIGLFWLNSERLRKKVWLFYGLGFIVAFIGFGIVTPAKQKNETQNQTEGTSTNKQVEAKQDTKAEVFVTSDPSKNQLNNGKSILFNEFTSYSVNPYTKSGYEDIKTYYYGVYLNLPTDTTGIAYKIVGYLKEKNYNDADAIHIWFFTDSTLIPKSFAGDWSTAKSRKKCFAHAVKLNTATFLTTMIF